MIPNGSITVASRRVLLIENSPSDRQLLRNWLNAEMIETYEAVDIITALSACQKYLPNLILLQLRLNTWDGYEVIRRLKDDPRTRSIPVIFLAASALTAEKAKGIDMGAVDFVSKPFDSVELLARVNSALRTKALLDLLESRAHLDGLTELGNRFALQDTLPLEVAACRQKDAPLSVMIADIDHFKKVNDHYGHAAGDEVLAADGDDPARVGPADRLPRPLRRRGVRGPLPRLRPGHEALETAESIRVEGRRPEGQLPQHDDPDDHERRGRLHPVPLPRRPARNPRTRRPVPLPGQVQRPERRLVLGPRAPGPRRRAVDAPPGGPQVRPALSPTRCPSTSPASQCTRSGRATR